MIKCPCGADYRLKVEYHPLQNNIRPFKYNGSWLNRNDLRKDGLDDLAHKALIAHYTPRAYCPRCKSNTEV